MNTVTGYIGVIGLPLWVAAVLYVLLRPRINWPRIIWPRIVWRKDTEKPTGDVPAETETEEAEWLIGWGSPGPGMRGFYE